MPGDKRKNKNNDRSREGGDRDRRRRYRYDGTPIQPNVSGPSVWVTCVRGKERAAVGELYDLFEGYASEMYPPGSSSASTSTPSTSTLSTSTAEVGEDADSEEDEEDEDIEKQIAKEVAGMKRPRKERKEGRFASCQTNTSCFVVISCKPPIDPIHLVVKHVENVLRTGITQTKFAQRLTPISGTCVTNVQEIKALCSRLLEPHLTDAPKFSYKIELRMRNHNTLSRPTIIEELAKCVPEGHKVDLENPELFVLVEIWKSVCGIGIVKDYYKLQKFNVMEIAKSEEPGFKAGVAGTGRVQEKTKEKVEEGKEEEKEKAGKEKEKERSVQESDS